LQGQSTSWDDTLFGQYDMHHYQVARMRMIRTPEWKLVRHFEPEGHDELYHLAEDPGETHDLANLTELKSRAQRDALARRLEGWMAQIGDRVAWAPTGPQGVAPFRPSSETAGRTDH
jgi:choline-sulfatase